MLQQRRLPDTDTHKHTQTHSHEHPLPYTRYYACCTHLHLSPGDCTRVRRWVCVCRRVCVAVCVSPCVHVSFSSVRARMCMFMCSGGTYPVCCWHSTVMSESALSNGHDMIRSRFNWGRRLARGVRSLTSCETHTHTHTHTHSERL